MPVIQSDIRDTGIKRADIYYQLALNPVSKWLTTETYAIGNEVRIYSVGVTRNDDVQITFRSLTDANTGNDPLTDNVNWEEYSDITEKCIEDARILVEAFVIGLNKDYSEDDKFQKLAIIKWASGLLIKSANQSTASDQEDSAGMDEIKEAQELLYNVYKFKTDEAPIQSPIPLATMSNGTVRTLQEVDPNSYYNKNYNSRDLGK